MTQPKRPEKPNSTRNRIRRFFAASPGREMRTIQFARWYGVHRVTVSSAIRQMVADGELVRRHGSDGKEIYYTTPKESA